MGAITDVVSAIDAVLDYTNKFADRETYHAVKIAHAKVMNFIERREATIKESQVIIDKLIGGQNDGIPGTS